MIVAAMFSSGLFLQLPGDLQREGEGPAEEEIHSDLQPESQGAPKRWAVCGRWARLHRVHSRDNAVLENCSFLL